MVAEAGSHDRRPAERPPDADPTPAERPPVRRRDEHVGAVRAFEDGRGRNGQPQDPLARELHPTDGTPRWCGSSSDDAKANARRRGVPRYGRVRGRHHLDRRSINRVFTDRFRLFRFETFIGPSRAGDFDALQLDYDLKGNPPVIRSIKDEIREIEPGLWLGQAWLKTSKREILWLYFALARADA